MLKRSLRRGALVGGVLVFIALIGAPAAFAREPVVRGVVTLSQLLLAIGALLAGSGAAPATRTRSTGAVVAAGAIAGAVCMLLLALLALLVSAVDLRQVLVNATPQLVDELTLGRGVVTGSTVLVVLGTVLGALGGWSTRLPAAISRSAVLAGAAVVVVGVLRDKGLAIAEAVALGVAVWAVAYGRSRWGSALATRYQRVQRRNSTMVSIVVWIAGLFILLGLPSILGTYGTSVLDLVGLYVLMGLGLNIVVGYAGLLDLGYVAFFTIGAYVTGLLTSPAASTQLGLSFWIAWPLAMVAAAGAGALLGIPVLRMRGDYLAIVTLGFGEIIRILVLSDTFKSVLGGAQGIIEIPGPSIGSFTMMRPQHFYYLILIGVMIVVFVSRRISDSRVGRAWMAIREDEDVAEATGVNLVKYKLLAFAMGASFSGIGGAIFASWVHSVFPNSFTLLVSINILSLVIVGGIGSIPGVILGAFFLVGLPEVLRSFADFRMITFGALLVAMMIARPEGLWPAKSRRRELHLEVAE
ncbi:MAG: hypothetical protein GXX93_02080 [Anaerolineae bacterium]|nr:hypothetical protein [Anaerolineae bacterium]